MALYVTVSHPHVKKKTHTQNGSIPENIPIFCQCAREVGTLLNIRRKHEVTVLAYE
jgi:hypothetical protein